MTKHDLESISKIKRDHQLSEKQARFVWFYNGNGLEACRLAGYQGSTNVLGVTAHRNLKHPKIVQAIKAKTLSQSAAVLSPQEILTKWSEIANDPDNDLKDRIKCLENLARSHAMFTDKQVNLNLNKYDRLDAMTDSELDQLLLETMRSLVGERPELVKLVELTDSDPDL